MGKFFTKGPFKLEYLTFGHGDRVLLAFHGFGRRAEDFSIFAPLLEDRYTIYSFNLFGHGRTEYPPDRIEKNTLQKEELADIFLSFLHSKGIERFSLMGYSLGGKVALSLTTSLPTMVDELFLFAPDGLKIAWWYEWLSKLSIGRKLYQRIIDNPSPFFSMIDLANRLGLMGNKMHRFIHFHMKTRAQRQLVHDIWMIFRDIKPDLRLLRHYLEENYIKTDLFFGKYDRIIPSSLGRKLTSNREVNIHELEAGHILLTKRTREYLGSHFSNIFSK